MVYLPPWKIWYSQIGSSSQLLGNIKNVPNHQPLSSIIHIINITTIISTIYITIYWCHIYHHYQPLMVFITISCVYSIFIPKETVPVPQLPCCDSGSSGGRSAASICSRALEASWRPTWIPWLLISKYSNNTNIIYVQCEAPKISKLAYKSNNYGLWYL